MPITMEAEVPVFFLTCFLVVFVLKALIGSVLLFRTVRGTLPLFLLHLACELLSFWFVMSVLFRGRMELFPRTIELSIDNSMGIGLFGVFWFPSVCFLLALVGRLVVPFLKKSSSAH